MPEDDRVVVRVHHAGAGVDALDHLVEVRPGRYPRAYVQELADSPLGQRPGGAVHEVTVHPRHLPDGGKQGDDLLGGGRVHGVVVLAAEEVVVHAGRLRLAGVYVGRAEACVCHLGSPVK